MNFFCATFFFFFFTLWVEKYFIFFFLISFKKKYLLPVGPSNFNFPNSRPQNLPFPKINKPKNTESENKLRECMKRSGELTINGLSCRVDIKDLEDLGELGNGTSGHVCKMKHKESGTIIAVKQMRRTGNDEENKRIIMDIDVVLKSHDCPYIVQCLGCFITEADVWICMELMTTCFDKLLKKTNLPVPEDILGKVTLAVSRSSFLLFIKQFIN